MSTGRSSQSVTGARWACRTAAPDAQSAHPAVLHSGRLSPSVQTLFLHNSSIMMFSIFKFTPLPQTQTHAH